MAAKDWVDVAQVTTGIVAACGLILTACGLAATACQMRRTRLVADLQALQKFYRDANDREAALADAKNKDDAAQSHAFNEFLNFLELYACAYNHGLVIGSGGKKIIRHKLEDSYIELNHAKEWHPLIAKALDRSTTFAELSKFIHRHKKEGS